MTARSASATPGITLGRKGAGLGGAAGLAAGLVAPVVALPMAVGGAIVGGALGKFVGHKARGGIEEKVAEAIAAGSAVVIGVFPATARFTVDQALEGSLAKSVVESDDRGVRALAAAMKEAMAKFHPDRTALPLPNRGFGGAIGRTIDESVGDWTIVPGPKPPEGAPNVLIVLIDDAGFGGPDTFGGGIRTPTLSRVQQMGLTYNRFHVTAVCSPTRAALLTGRNHHRVGMGGIRSSPGRSPDTPECGPAAARRCPGFCPRTATSPAASASGT